MSFIGNWFDIAFISIIAISAILAFLRGFIRDFAAFMNWVISTFLTYLLTPFIVGLFAKSDYAEVVNKLTVSCILFIILLIVTSLVTSRIATNLSDKIPSSVNQSLGFAFGFAKAYIVCALIFSIIIIAYHIKPKSNGKIGPEWLTASKSYKILEVGADGLKPVAKGILKTFNGNKLIEEERVREKIQKKIDNYEKSKAVKKAIKETSKESVKETIKETAKQKVKDTTKASEGKGYDSKESQKMNHLIDVIEKDK
jgi:membrane protein required for colicin V production